MNWHFLFMCLMIDLTITQFTVLPLGTKGAFEESNLSAYALSTVTDNETFIMLDGGTIAQGLFVLENNGYLQDYVPNSMSAEARAGYFLKQQIKSYLISHAHLDHVKGLIINSNEDTKKSIVGINKTLTYLQSDIFNFQIWPNFGPSGIKQYSFIYAEDGVPFSIPNTNFTVEAYHLRHSYPYLSTAFLISNPLGQYFLYFGDVGPDSVENTLSTPNDLNTNLIVWQRVAPLVDNESLFAIFIECSFLDPKPASSLFGHLTPSYLSEELAVLESATKNISGKSKPLSGLNVVVTHIKSLPSGVDILPNITAQLAALNTFGVNYIIPEQGEPLTFPLTVTSTATSLIINLMLFFLWFCVLLFQ